MAVFAQTGKDTVVYNLPTVDGHLVYTGSISLKNKSKVELDTAAKKKGFPAILRFIKLTFYRKIRIRIAIYQARARLNFV
jgi:hypothetical protein